MEEERDGMKRNRALTRKLFPLDNIQIYIYIRGRPIEEACLYSYFNCLSRYMDINTMDFCKHIISIVDNLHVYIHVSTANRSFRDFMEEKKNLLSTPGRNFIL